MVGELRVADIFCVALLDEQQYLIYRVVASYLTFVSFINVLFNTSSWNCHQQCSVPCANILHWANVCFSAHAISQPRRLWTHNQRNVSTGLGMLQVRKNVISLLKCSGSSAHLRTLEGTQVTRESARFDNNDSESKSQVGLLKFPEEN